MNTMKMLLSLKENFIKKNNKVSMTNTILPIGTKIYAYGAYMAQSIWAVCSNDAPQKIVKMSDHDDTDDYFPIPIRTLDRGRPIKEKKGIGFYYDIEAPLYNASQIDEALQRAYQTIEKQKQDKIDKDKAQRKELRMLREKYSYLKPISISKARTEQIAIRQNLASELKHKFPKVRFSIKKRSYDSYVVKWTDGPAYEDVDEICTMFEAYETDYTGDFRDYKPSEFNLLFGGFKYVFAERFYGELIYDMLEKYDHNIKIEIKRLLYDTEIPRNYYEVKYEDGEIVFNTL